MKRYFFMEQDHALMDEIGIRDFDIHGNRHVFTWDDHEKVRDITSLYLAGSNKECAPDFVMSPVYMISEMAKKVIDMYEDDVVFKKIVLIDKEKEKQIVYFHLLLKEIEALDETTEYYPNGMEKRMILSRQKAGEHKAFLLKDSKIKLPIVSLDIVESLLRRHVMGIKFKEIEVI